MHGSLRAFGVLSKPTIGVKIGGSGQVIRGTDLTVKISDCVTPIANVGNSWTRIVGTIRQGTTTTVLRR